MGNFYLGFPKNSHQLQATLSVQALQWSVATRAELQHGTEDDVNVIDHCGRLLQTILASNSPIRYDTRCCFNVRQSKADISQLRRLRRKEGCGGEDLQKIRPSTLGGSSELRWTISAFYKVVRLLLLLYYYYWGHLYSASSQGPQIGPYTFMRRGMVRCIIIVRVGAFLWDHVSRKLVKSIYFFDWLIRKIAWCCFGTRCISGFRPTLLNAVDRSSFAHRYTSGIDQQYA